MTEPQLTVFKSHAPTMGYVFRSGKSIHFMGGRYATAIKSEIDELTEECSSGQSNYYIDSGETTMDASALDPIASLRAKIREEERAILLAATNPGRDMGTTQNTGKLEGISNSNSIRGLQVDSESQGVAARQINVASTAKATKL
jgi:hypothetical protein